MAVELPIRANKKNPPHFSGEKVRRFLEIWIGYGNIKCNSIELRTFVIH